MVDDQQTHAIPRGAAAMDRVAQLHGLVNGEALLDLLRPHVERTGRYSDGLVADSDDERLPKETAALETWLNGRSEEHTSELQSLMRISYAVFCLKKKKYQAHNVI